MACRAHHHRALAAAVHVLGALVAHDDAARREVGPGKQLQHPCVAHIGVADELLQRGDTHSTISKGMVAFEVCFLYVDPYIDRYMYVYLSRSMYFYTCPYLSISISISI